MRVLFALPAFRFGLLMMLLLYSIKNLFFFLLVSVIQPERWKKLKERNILATRRYFILVAVVLLCDFDFSSISVTADIQDADILLCFHASVTAWLVFKIGARVCVFF